MLAWGKYFHLGEICKLTEEAPRPQLTAAQLERIATNKAKALRRILHIQAQETTESMLPHQASAAAPYSKAGHVQCSKELLATDAASRAGAQACLVSSSDAPGDEAPVGKRRRILATWFDA